MFAIVLFSIISVVNTQYLSNNYNSWSSYSQNYPSWNNRASVRGNLFSDDSSVLPYGSRITVSLVDTSLQDVAARPLNTVVFYGSYRFPIAYEISYSTAQVQANNMQQYAIQARIEKDGQLLYINDQYTPVQLIPVPLRPINIVLKNVGGSNYPGKSACISCLVCIFIFVGIYTTRPPIISGLYFCQLRPEPGLCYASIEQYYFNPQLRSCQIFIWGGCGGNQNRFSSREECERTCSIYRRRMTNDNAKQISMG
jgi:uncharacterized lipoprotein YbaY